MPHEGPHQSWLRVTPELLAFALSPERDVLLRVDLPRDDSMVVLQMTAHDARLIAEAIIAKAKEAEAASAGD
jgi:hypothetical protein